MIPDITGDAQISGVYWTLLIEVKFYLFIALQYALLKERFLAGIAGGLVAAGIAPVRPARPRIAALGVFPGLLCRDIPVPGRGARLGGDGLYRTRRRDARDRRRDDRDPARRAGGAGRLPRRRRSPVRTRSEIPARPSLARVSRHDVLQQLPLAQPRRRSRLCLVRRRSCPRRGCPDRVDGSCRRALPDFRAASRPPRPPLGGDGSERRRDPCKSPWRHDRRGAAHARLADRPAADDRQPRLGASGAVALG